MPHNHSTVTGRDDPRGGCDTALCKGLCFPCHFEFCMETELERLTIDSNRNHHAQSTKLLIMKAFQHPAAKPSQVSQLKPGLGGQHTHTQHPFFPIPQQPLKLKAIKKTFIPNSQLKLTIGLYKNSLSCISSGLCWVSVCCNTQITKPPPPCC